MISNAKALSLTVVVFATSFGAANIAIKNGLRHRSPTATPMYATSAAFRDGIYQGKMDLQLGRTQHLMTGRWSREQDRRLFVLGYMQSYGQGADSARVSARPEKLTVARGYFDGLTDGMKDRRASTPFRLVKTSNYLHSGMAGSEISGAESLDRQSYRTAYSNGYQQGFYAAE